MTREEIEQKAIEAAAIAVAIADDEEPPPAKFDHPAISDWSEHVARAAIAAYEAAMWQMMETAPRDASWFLAGCETTYDIFGSNTFWAATARFEYDYDTQPEMMMPNGDYGPQIMPTHWRPLPLPPKGKEP